MTRWDWMYLKACVPPLFVVVAACIIAVMLKRMESSPILGGIAAFAPWVALAGLAGAALLMAEPTLRFLRWERGEGPCCHRCGGPLGEEVNGRYGPYRRCLACDGTTSARRYS